MENLSLLVLHLGRIYLQPDGSSTNSADRGWLGSARTERASLRVLTLYRSVRAFRLIPAILLHTLQSPAVCKNTYAGMLSYTQHQHDNQKTACCQC